MPDLVWRVLSVSAGAYGSHQLTGISRIVKTVISPLADFKVSVLVISTYQSDYVLVSFGITFQVTDSKFFMMNFSSLTINDFRILCKCRDSVVVSGWRVVSNVI